MGSIDLSLGRRLLRLEEVIKEKIFLFYDDLTWNTALHVAAFEGRVELVKILLFCGVPVDLQNAAGDSALHLATRAKRLEVCTLLLRAGADLLLENEDDQWPLLLAISLDSFDLVDLFLRFKSHRLNAFSVLAKAFGLGKEAAVRAFAKNGFTLQLLDERLRGTLLHAMLGVTQDHKVFQKLVDAGIDLDAADHQGATALHILCQNSPNTRIIEVILKGGANVNAVDKTPVRGTPLFAATTGTAGQNLEVIKLLVEYGADVFQTYTEGRTILHIAAQDAIPEIVEYYLSLGLDVNAADENGRTAAYWAAQHGHTEAIRVMLKYGLDLSKDKKNQAMGAALMDGKLELVQLLLDHGASLVYHSDIVHARESKNGKDMPLLLLVTKNSDMSKDYWFDKTGMREGSKEAEEEISERSGDREIKEARLQDLSAGDIELSLDPEGSEDETSDGHLKSTYDSLQQNLLFQMRAKQYETVAAAIECGASLSGLPQAALGILCLVCAEYNLLQATKALVSSKAPTATVSSPRSWTALHIAAWKGHLKILRLLRSGGWDLGSEDNQGKTVMHLAAENGHEDIVEELLGAVSAQHGDRDGNTPLHLAAFDGNIGIVSRLVEAGALVSKSNAGGMLPLHFACMLDHLEVTILLVEAGSSLLKPDHLGLSALHYAARYNSVRILKYLLSLDMDLNVRTNGGSSALHLAAQHGHTTVANSLLEAGCDPNLRDNQTLSPLEIAVSNKNIVLAKQLIGKSEIRWLAPRDVNILFHALQTRNFDIASLVLSNMQSSLSKKEFMRMVRKILPELLADLLTDPKSSAEVCTLLIPYLPENEDVRFTLGYHILMSIIKHTDDPVTVEILLKMDPVMAQQVTRDNWRPLLSASKHGRKKTVETLLRYGARTDVKPQGSGKTAVELARTHSPESGIEEKIKWCEGIRSAVWKRPELRMAWVKLRQDEANLKFGGRAKFYQIDVVPEFRTVMFSK